MLVPTDKPTAANPQSERLTPCIECGVPTSYKTTNRVCCSVCSETRRRESYRKAAEVQRRKKGIVQVKGVEAKCDNCPSIIVRRTRTHRLCEACSPGEALKRARVAQDRKSRAIGRPQFGEDRECSYCGSGFNLRQPRQTYCDQCSEQAVAGSLPTYRAMQAKRKRERYATEPDYSLNSRMRRALYHSLRDLKAGRSWESLVGYTVEDLKRHLERQFSKGMSWKNRDKWQIDHILPVSSFSFTSAEDPEFRAAWALSNLRPLWAEENLEKRAHRLFLL